MAHTFASDAWIDAFFGELRGDDKVRQHGATWVYGPAVLLIEADPDKQFGETVALRVDLHEGEARDVRQVPAQGAAAKAPFVIAAPYSRWKDVVQGRLGVVDGLLQGRLRFKGDLPTVHRHADLMTALFAAAGRVDTAFPDEVEAGEPAGAAR